MKSSNIIVITLTDICLWQPCCILLNFSEATTSMYPLFVTDSGYWKVENKMQCHIIWVIILYHSNDYEMFSNILVIHR